MERRYLVAALAIIATFAVFSHGLRTLERVSLSYGQHVGMNAKAKCNADASAATRFIGKMRTHLRPSYPEEAQLLAEMNLPIAVAEVKVVEQVARQNMAAAQCARATALREAERARRQATRMRERMARTRENASGMPIAWGASAADVDEQVRAQTAALAKHIAANQVGEFSLQISDSDVTGTDDSEADQDSDDSNDASARVHSTAAQSWQAAAQTIRTKSRVMVHEVGQALGYK